MQCSENVEMLDLQFDSSMNADTFNMSDPKTNSLIVYCLQYTV